MTCKQTSSTAAVLLRIIFLALCAASAKAHGLMTIPVQRGALPPSNRFNSQGKYPGAPADQKAHFPAGDKDSSPGAGARSQMRAAGPAGWTPFAPLEDSFRWRAGVCGDEIGKPQAHMRGGEFYYGAKITENYTQGGVIEVEINIVAHHNGFVQLHVCDVAKCGGEISEDCFKEGHCYKLLRAPNPDCDAGFDKLCAPIDPDYPGRWYLPCRTAPEKAQERFGGKKMLYKLPKDLVCEHCVIHWFWSAANTCNPPGVVEYYEGPNGPKAWGQCVGQGGARGGVTKVQKDCASDRFPEEYYQCADVSIMAGKGPEKEPSPAPLPVPSSTAVFTATPTPVSKPEEPNSSPAPGSMVPHQSMYPQDTPRLSQGIFNKLILVADGETIQSLPDGCMVDIRKYSQISIEAITSEDAETSVKFFIDDELAWTDYQTPYFLFGNKKRVPNYWPEPIVNKFFLLRVESGDDSMQARIYLVG